MTPDEFRSLALGLPEAAEHSHMNHPDFRVRGRIFATLGYPSNAHGVVKLTPPQQKAYVRAEPDVFEPVKGYWGEHGATIVKLRAARKTSVRKALQTAWANTAPRTLVRAHDVHS